MLVAVEVSEGEQAGFGGTLEFPVEVDPASEERSLQSVLDEEGPFAPHDAICIVLELCRVLQAARAEGDRHGELSTSNIFLDVEGRVRIGRRQLRGCWADSEKADIEAAGQLLRGMITKPAGVGVSGSSCARVHRITSRALGLDTRNRYATIGELAHDLERGEWMHLFKAVLVSIGLLGLMLLLAGQAAS